MISKRQKNIEIHELIKRISQSEDQIAFRELFTFYYPRLLNFAQYLLESKYASDIVISSVFTELWKRRKKLVGITGFDNYLLKATKNACLNYLRDDRRLRYENIGAHECKLTKSIESPEDKFISNEMRAEIIRAIDSLPPKCRQIFELVREDGFKYREVAELLEISEKTVENQMGRAYSKLRVKLSHFKHVSKKVM